MCVLKSDRILRKSLRLVVTQTPVKEHKLCEKFAWMQNNNESHGNWLMKYTTGSKPEQRRKSKEASSKEIHSRPTPICYGNGAILLYT